MSHRRHLPTLRKAAVILAGIILAVIALGFCANTAQAARGTGPIDGEHCHADGTRHDHSAFVSGAAPQPEYAHYLDTDDGWGLPQPTLDATGRVKLPGGWRPADDPAWHNHGDDDIFWWTPADSTGCGPDVPTATATPTADAPPDNTNNGASSPRRDHPTAAVQRTVAPPGCGSAPYPHPYIRDADLGQTYALVQRDGCTYRQWIAPDNPLVYRVPWADVTAHHTHPVTVILTIALDRAQPWHAGNPTTHMLTRRFDGSDVRIFVHTAAGWEHVPDIATFTQQGYRWEDVTAADAAFWRELGAA